MGVDAPKKPFNLLDALDQTFMEEEEQSPSPDPQPSNSAQAPNLKDYFEVQPRSSKKSRNLEAIRASQRSQGMGHSAAGAGFYEKILLRCRDVHFIARACSRVPC